MQHDDLLGEKGAFETILIFNNVTWGDIVRLCANTQSWVSAKRVPKKVVYAIPN